MRQVIDKKLYDTEKAIEIDSYEWNVASDLHYVCEKLFKTEKGNYFLYAKGGACSKYGYSEGNSSYPDSRIIPLTKEEAYDWLEKYGYVSKLIEEFKDYIEEA